MYWPLFSEPEHTHPAALRLRRLLVAPLTDAAYAKARSNNRANRAEPPPAPDSWRGEHADRATL